MDADASQKEVPVFGLLFAIIGWLLAGLLAGWLAGLVTRGRGYGCCADILLGWLGAIAGGLLFSALLGFKPAGFIGSVFVAFVGALILLLFARLISSGSAGADRPSKGEFECRDDAEWSTYFHSVASGEADVNHRPRGMAMMRQRRFEVSVAPYAVGGIVLLFLLMATVVALVLFAVAIGLVLVVAACAWIAWRMLPFRKALPSKSPVERLTDHYVAGRIDISEFERRVAKILHRP